MTTIATVVRHSSTTWHSAGPTPAPAPPPCGYPNLQRQGPAARTVNPHARARRRDQSFFCIHTSYGK